MTMSLTIQNYLSKVQEVYATGKSTEHSYRPALQDFFKEITWYKVTNEPSRSEHGAPDFLFHEGMFPVCYAEHKDINIPLEKIEKSEQLSRYFGYAKLILTNGIEFRFYRNGTRYGEPIVLAELEKWHIVVKQENFEYFKKSLDDFFKDYVDTIRNAKELAKIMWGKARRIRDNVIDMLHFEKEDKFLEIKQMKKVFKELLIHDLDDKKFADLYAQTLVYGLFVARYNDKTSQDFSRREALELVPKSNPLLRKFFDHIAGEAFEKRLAYIVDELCQIFLHADVHALMHGLYQKKDIETHDPVIHFYEDFLKEYDSELRMERWVFYTPMPVVRFMVRAIDEILKKHFDLGRGLLDTSKIDIERWAWMFEKDWRKKTTTYWMEKKKVDKVHRVQLLDPATGTGTFLNEVVRFIHEKMHNQQWLWKEYVNSDLLPRIHGFELMMASYTIAHLKLGLTLAETGIDDIKQRLKIYLTNSLEEWIKVQNDLLSFWLMGSITEEAQQAGHIKSEEPIMIVLGNPPYSGVSSNNGEWITQKIEDYKYVNGVHFWERKHWLQDDYVKFFRLWESLIERRWEWILAFITNHWYIDNPTFRGMRWHLLQTFDEIYIVDLHGNSKKKETAADGSADQNVFDIQQGVSIFFGIKTGKKKKWELAKVFHQDVFGKREMKYSWLTEDNFESISWKRVELDNKFYFFCPKDFWLQEKYSEGFWIDKIFLKNVTGIQTWNDKLFVNINREILEKNLEIIEQNQIPQEFMQKIMYRPFDNQFWFYLSEWLKTEFKNIKIPLSYRSRFQIMKNFLSDNLGLIVWRQWQVVGWDEWNLVYISNHIVDLNSFYRGWWMVFPLYLYSESWTFQTWEWEVKVVKNPNLDETIWKKINKVVWETTPEDILDYIYAVLHSKTYRETYKEFLKIDFPKVPYPKDKANFFELVKFGRELRSFHLLENPKVYDFITSYPVSGDNVVWKVQWKDEKVYINSSQYFWWVSKEIFEFQIGGYKPAEKYLKDRKDRALSSEEFENYQKMIVALSETIRIMNEIDKVFKG